MSHVTLKGICAASVFFGVAITLLPEGKERRAASLCVTAALCLMILGLCGAVDWESYAVSLAQTRSAADAISADADAQSRTLNRLVIERSCEEYILDKAAELSLPVRSVKVMLRWSREEVWVPERAEIVLERDAEGRAALSSLIEAQLGIPEQNQEWSIEGDTR